jgi:hypothetical protein
MSYDLNFNFGNNRPSPKELSGHFVRRPNYELTKGQVVYQNEKTGVYFIFNWKMPGDQEDDEDADATFILNYFRPYIFALEAEPEVAAFIERFEPSIEDPQVDGMEDTYSRDGFLRGWKSGNKFACDGLKGGREGKKMAKQTLPAAEIERCWRWNLDLPKLDEEINADIFLPRIRPCLYEGKMVTAICWPEAVPIAIPEVDIVLVGRINLKGKEETLVMSYQSVVPHLEAYLIRDGAAPYRLLSYETPPQNLVDFFMSLPITKDKGKIIPVDDVLETELFE